MWLEDVGLEANENDEGLLDTIDQYNGRISGDYSSLSSMFCRHFKFLLLWHRLECCKQFVSDFLCAIVNHLSKYATNVLYIAGVGASHIGAGRL